MRLSSALYVRQWLAKLHPPLPQTPRESQQLLRILEGSFRKHLDEVHPSPAQKNAFGESHLDIPLASPASSSSATQHYFDTVLNHPLIAKPSDKAKADASLTASATSLFMRASNEGNITIPLLRRCAEDYLKGLKNGEQVTNKDGLAQRFASWVYTTSLSMREAFFASTEVLDLAVRVAGVDKQEAIAWDWLRMLYERQSVSGSIAADAPLNDEKWLSAEDVMVSYIMRLSIRRGNLEDVAQQFVEACRYRAASGRAAVELVDDSKGLTYVPMSYSWKRLAASIVHYRSKHGISEDLFTRMLQYGMPWSLVPQFSIPVVLVYHPTAPSAMSLSQHLRDTETANQFLSGQTRASKRFRTAMLLMILDGAQISLEQGHKGQAQFLLDFAHTHYSEFLPTNELKPIPSLDVQIRNAQGELKAHSYNFAWS